VTHSGLQACRASLIVEAKFPQSNFSSIFLSIAKAPLNLLFSWLSKEKNQLKKRRSKLDNEKLYANLHSYSVINELCVAVTRSGKRETSATGSVGQARCSLPERGVGE
jgi:hypothetical protein